MLKYCYQWSISIYLIFMFALACLVVLLSVRKVLALTVLHIIPTYNQVESGADLDGVPGVHLRTQKLWRSVRFN
jgi:hypothetical protein